MARNDSRYFFPEPSVGARRQKCTLRGAKWPIRRDKYRLKSNYPADSIRVGILLAGRRSWKEPGKIIRLTEVRNGLVNERLTVEAARSGEQRKEL